MCSGDAITISPLEEDDAINIGDIVFCEVQEGNRFYVHMVRSRDWCHHNKEYKWWIGNIRGRLNGWCLRKHIYGKVTEVEFDWGGEYHRREGWDNHLKKYA